MLTTLKSVNYNKKLIKMLIDSKSGAIAVNILGPIFYFYIFSGTIPFIILFTLILIQFSLYILRVIYGEKLLKTLQEKGEFEANKSLAIYLQFLYISSFFWGLSTIPVIYHGNESQLFTIMALVFVMLAGSLATLTPVFHAVFIFIFNIVTLFILGLIICGTSAIYYQMIFFLLIFAFVSIPSAFKIHTALRDYITKSEEIQKLNEELELKVKQAIQNTAKKEKLLQEQTRLAQMGEMISMIAHQWRQPLGAISSALMSISTKQESGKYDLDNKEDREKFLVFMTKKHTNIDNYVQVLSTTIDDFRNFLKPDKKRELVSIEAPILKALNIVQSSLESKNIILELELFVKDKILLYQNEMMQVILNIIKNAEDNFIEKKIQNPTLCIKTYKNDVTLFISITDNGGGINENIINNIFDPYFSTKNEKNGTGLGLYMSKIIVQEHNKGNLSVNNTNEGVRFLIEFTNDKSETS